MTRPALRSWLSPLVSPAVFDFWAGRLRPGTSWDRPLARVVSRTVEARDAVTLVLQPNRHFAGFRAGQHVNVGVEVDGVRHTRSYSPSDAPRADGRVSITVRHVPGGKVSAQLCLHTRIDDVLELGPAFGALTARRA
jgi:stearoyl-CoA 9-desaturase NADPH oxidoreductase